MRKSLKCQKRLIYVKSQETKNSIFLMNSKWIYDSKSPKIIIFENYQNSNKSPNLTNLTKHNPANLKNLIYLTHYRPAVPFGNRKNILEDLFSLVIVTI